MTPPALDPQQTIELTAKIAAVPRQAEVNAADLATATADKAVVDPIVLAIDGQRALESQIEQAVATLRPDAGLRTTNADLARPAADVALDGQAWHVFNTLRGKADAIPLLAGGVATFDDVRAALAGP